MGFYNFTNIFNSEKINIQIHETNRPQIDHLFTFTRQHYVEWYDLQSELVDHLANAIETQWQENPKLSFNEALNKEFKFGVLVLWM
jgi:hypothetical protein